MNEYKYDLNNPIERADLIEDARRLFKNSEIWAHYPASCEYKFHSITEAIMAVLHHAMEVDAIGDERFVSCKIHNVGSLDVGIHIIAASGGDYSCSYYLKKVESYDYKFRPQEVKVTAPQEVKVEDQKPAVAKTDETKEEPTTTTMTPLKGVYKMNLSPKDLFDNDKDEKTAMSIREFVNRIAPGAGYRAERLDEKSVQITIY